ncbi:MAG: hypothetical protein ACI9HY_003895 [Planctomycetaceae bacterium]|jgi:hypothetical protein
MRRGFLTTGEKLGLEPHNCQFGDIQVIWRDGGQLIPASDSRDTGVSKVTILPYPYMGSSNEVSVFRGFGVPRFSQKHKGQC